VCLEILSTLKRRQANRNRARLHSSSCGGSGKFEVDDISTLIAEIMFRYRRGKSYSNRIRHRRSKDHAGPCLASARAASAGKYGCKLAGRQAWGFSCRVSWLSMGPVVKLVHVVRLGGRVTEGYHSGRSDGVKKAPIT
jgi:hypothetical protein